MKKGFKKILKAFFSLFYRKEYLQGKHFDASWIGYVWCFRSLFRVGKLRRRQIYFPLSNRTRLSNGKNLTVDPSSLNVFQQPGCYFQDETGTIYIGKDVHIAANVGIITSNHNPENPDEHLPAKNVVIGDHCWIGMNAVVLPGVTLGEYTTVGAGSVVTHSFDGYCVIAGNPARLLRQFSSAETVSEPLSEAVRELEN